MGEAEVAEERKVAAAAASARSLVEECIVDNVFR